MMIQIIPFKQELAPLFKSFNEIWLTELFDVDEQDRAILSDPQHWIIDKGGHILFIRLNDEVVGCCALINHGDGKYELAKMAMLPEYRGRGLGQKLGSAVVDLAKSLGARSLFLVSSTQLSPALSLYRKLGFIDQDGGNLKNKLKCNVRMEYPIT